MAKQVAFIHGQWIHAGSRQPWMDLFKQKGYEPTTPAGRVTVPQLPNVGPTLMLCSAAVLWKLLMATQNS